MPRRKPNEPHWTNCKALKAKLRRTSDWQNEAEARATREMQLILWTMAHNYPIPRYLGPMLKDAMERRDAARVQ